MTPVSFAVFFCLGNALRRGSLASREGVCSRAYRQRKTAFRGALFSARLHLARDAARMDVFLLRPRYFMRVFALNGLRRGNLRVSTVRVGTPSPGSNRPKRPRVARRFKSLRKRLQRHAALAKVSRRHSVDAFTQANRCECRTGTADQECAPGFPFMTDPAKVVMYVSPRRTFS